MSSPDRVRALTIMGTWAWPLPPAEFHTCIFPWRMMHAPLVGPYLLGNHRALAGLMRPCYRTRPRGFLPGIGCAGFRSTRMQGPSSVSNSSNRNLLPQSWGREGEVFDAATFASRFKQLLPDAEGPHLVTGRHFLQEDSAAEIARLIGSFLDRLDESERRQ
jgi:hypothetical protein